MSDVLLIGETPESEEGKEFFLHCSDWWYEMLEVINISMSDDFPVDEYFYRDSLLAPPTPHMAAEESRRFSALLSDVINSGAARECLDKYYHEDPLLIDYFEGDEDKVSGTLEERLQQLEEFTRFLKNCGGCKAKW